MEFDISFQNTIEEKIKKKNVIHLHFLNDRICVL